MEKDIKKFAKELEKRTKQFAIDIIRVSMTLSNTPEGRTIRNQLTKAGNLEHFRHFSNHRVGITHRQF